VCMTGFRSAAIDQRLQRNAVGDHKRSAILPDKTLLPEIRENPADGLSRKSEHLRDFLLGELKLQPGRDIGFSVLGAPFQKQFRQCLGGRVSQFNPAHFLTSMSTFLT
jgi:hypothetical protein